MDRANKLRAWMQEQGLTQHDLAVRVGMTDGAISRFLNGHREITAEFEVAFLHEFGIADAAVALDMKVPA